MCDISCDDCPGYYTFNVPVGHPNFGRSFPCEHKQNHTALERVAELQKICGLNSVEQQYRLADLIETGGVTNRVIEAARAFVEKPAGFLTIWGGTGNGKTLVTMAVVNELIALGIPAMYTTLIDLESWIRQSYNRERAARIGDNADVDAALSDWQRIEKLARIRVLAIDEFDKVKRSEWTYQLEADIVDKRYRDGIAGLTGTLLAMNEFALPTHIESRVRDSRFTLIQNTDADMRIRRGA